MNLFTCAQRSIKIEESEYFIKTYRRFMSEFDKGGDPDYIRDLILYDAHKGICDNEYSLHDVYFALARAAWEIGRLPDGLLHIVGDIIRSGSDLEYFRIKSFPPEALDERRDRLNDFLCRIMLPNPSPRRRIPAEYHGLFEMRIGDVFSYLDDGMRRLLVIADRIDLLQADPMYFCCVPESRYGEVIPDAKTLMEERLGMMGLFAGHKMIPPEELTYEMHLDIPAGKYLELFEGDWLFQDTDSFYGDLHIKCRCTLRGFAECKPGCTEGFYPMNIRHGGADDPISGL